MKTRIQLSDADRSEEIFAVDVEEATASRLRVSVPNTIVSFVLTRGEEDAAYAGSLGERVYVFAEDLKARKTASKRA
jgi:hypothetical protein